jgi:hypothetical protein
LIYIVTPCLNTVETIDQTIESVVSQVGTFILHYHVQDGGSHDGTVEKLGSWSERIANSPASARIFFSWASEADCGVYDAVSKGLARLDIPDDAFLAWINADDILFSRALNIVAETYRCFPDIQWLCGIPTVIDMQGEVLAQGAGYCLPQAFISRGVCDGIHWTGFQQEGTFFRKSLWDKVGGLDLNFKLAGDWDLWRRMAEHAPVVHVSTALGAFRRRPGQLSSVQADRYKFEMDSTISPADRKKAMREFFRCVPKTVPVLDLVQGGLVYGEENRLSAFKQKVYLGLSGYGMVFLIRLYRKLRTLLTTRRGKYFF